MADCDKGNIAIVTALLLPVFVCACGIGVDMTRVLAAKTNLQKSLDSAALAAAKQYGVTQDKVVLERWAKAYFLTNAIDGANSAFSYDGAKVENGNTVIRVSALRREPTYFGGAIVQLFGGKDTFDVSATSEIIVQNRSIEMALVLDNSGSMSASPASGGSAKMTVLKQATTQLVDQLMAVNPSSNVDSPVTIGIVPFSGAVNVGPLNADQAWMDTKGLSPSHNDDFDWSSWKVSGVPQAKLVGGAWVSVAKNEPLTKFWLFKNIKYNGALRYKDGWEGCVASRPLGYAVTDDTPSTTKPATLFVPLMAPSEYNWTGSLDSIKNDWIPETASASGISDTTALTRQRDMNRYFGTTKTNAGAEGPSQVCNTKPITPLTTTKSKVQAAVTALAPLGGTNIAEGLAWGWRVLSSGAPFTEGRPAKTKDNLKIVVLMTDGENTYNPAYSTGQQVELTNANRSMFGTYGFGQILENGVLRPGRIFDSVKTTVKKAAIANITDAMNENLSIVCENIKKDGRNPDGSDGIVIFTIAFDLKDTSPVKQRLKACSSSGMTGTGAKLYYDAKDADDLLSAFKSITDEISSLRIAR
jgi:Flp pilus assembly protein TadG